MRIVSALSLALMFSFGATATAAAHGRHHGGRHHADARHHSYRHHYVYRNHRHRALAAHAEDRHDGHGLVHVQTAAGAITVASDVAGKFKGLIAALVAKGFKGDVHCYASSGHVSHSLHYSGRACDFAQDGRNKTVSIMYHAGDLIRSAGLRDGCSFHDCGHVDTGLAVASRHHEHRHVVAARRHTHGRYASYERYTRHRGYGGMLTDAGDSYGGAPRGRYRLVSLTYRPDGLTAQ